jgi:outer membrane protein assembly factor BamE (lipoprotein component of BamABCDE complex)
LLLVLVLPVGCMTAADHQRSLGSTQEREMTLGVVQKEIRVGMSQAGVATALGSPNIVTKDDEGKETWIYDKIASEASYSVSGGGASILIAGYSRSSGAASSTQKTLTVVIKYDKKGTVESVAYHTSKF